jgi:hypothetical protein
MLVGCARHQDASVVVDGHLEDATIVMRSLDSADGDQIWEYRPKFQVVAGEPVAGQ